MEPLEAVVNTVKPGIINIFSIINIINIIIINIIAINCYNY